MLQNKKTKSEKLKEQREFRERFMAKNKTKKNKKTEERHSEVLQSAYKAANIIMHDGDIAQASRTFIELQSEDEIIADWFWAKLEMCLIEVTGHPAIGNALFKMFKRRVMEDQEKGTYSNAVMTEENIKVEEKELNNFELLQKMTKAGLLSAEEAKRRGDIVLYNHIYDLFVSSVKDAKNFDEGNLLIHPETIQIMGYYGLALLELGGTVGRRVGVDHIN